MSQPDLNDLKNNAKTRIHELVNDYRQILAEGKKDSFNEERVKIAFVLPMLEALGWNPRTDEILPEQSTLSGRADFGLRVAGKTKIYVEMKSFKKDLDGHFTVKGKPRSFAEQAIQYAWGMKADWAVLTNFEETRLYDSHVKKPIDGLVWKNPIKFTEYESQFEQLWLISKNSVVSGALDAYRAKVSRPPVDKAFLEDLMKCRQLLAEDIITNNSGLTSDQINDYVQKILDRIIFIKNCEDRLIIPAETLWKRFNAWRETAIDQEIVTFMMDLKNTFRYFDKVYNGKLFEKHPCEDLQISNKVLETIITILYGDGEHLGYNFSVIPIDVLGQAYELYLGSLIKEKESQRKAIEIVKRKAMRKAHGIYYTPEYVVDFIVRETLGKLLRKCKTPEEVSKIKVLDPACGSGSFLIKAFDVLREWYEEYNKLNRPVARTGTLDAHIVPFPNPEEKILTENLYGVDLDPLAVEIAILNLSLKAVRTNKRLPYIADHIKCGNSIIDDEKITDKNFKWEKEFPEILKDGGFDVVIGNPPYGASLSKDERRYLIETYPANKNNTDSAISFINKSYLLLKNGGYLGMIVPKPLIYSSKWLACREFVKDDLNLLADVGRAFEEVLLEQVIIVMKKNANSQDYLSSYVDGSRKPITVSKKIIDYFGNLINDVSEDELKLAMKLNTGRYISDVADIYRGLFLLKYLKSKGDIPVYRGKSIGRFILKEPTEYLTRAVYDKIKSKVQILEQKKIVMQNILAHVTKPADHIILMATKDDEGIITLDNVGNIFIKDKKIDSNFLVALLNSRLLSWYAYRFVYAKAIRTMRFDKYHLSKMPLCEYQNKIGYEKVISLTQTLFLLQSKLHNMPIMSEKGKEIQDEIHRVDKEIDQEIYKLYGLSKEEIELVEANQ